MLLGLRRRVRRLRRHPFGFWLITFLLAGLVFSAVSRVGEQASLAEERWGRVATVVVARRAVAAGAVVDAADVVVESVPGRLVPAAGAFGSVDDVAGRVALVGLSPGEMVLRSRVAPDGVRGVAALVPAGMRAVAVPVGEGGLALSVGDVVDVLATFEVDPASGGAGAESEPTVVVAEGAAVIEVRADAVTLAVPPSAAARLAFALARSTLTLTLTSPTSPKSTGTVPVDSGKGQR